MFDPDLFRLYGQVAVVPGVGAGIGRGIARLFAGAGACVAVSDRGPAAAESVAAGIVAAGGRAAARACNVTQEEDLAALVGFTLDRFGRISILVNNAGGGRPKPFDMPMEAFRPAFDLNVFSVFRLTQLAAPHLAMAGDGAVLNISSMSGENRNRRMASDASSKAAENHCRRKRRTSPGRPATPTAASRSSDARSRPVHRSRGALFGVSWPRCAAPSRP